MARYFETKEVTYNDKVLIDLERILLIEQHGDRCFICFGCDHNLNMTVEASYDAVKEALLAKESNDLKKENSNDKA